VSGAVAAPRTEALAAGQEILDEGGNAVDAVVAMTFVLGVCEPYMTGPGAVGEAVYLTPDDRCVVMDAIALAPFRATSDMYELEPSGLDGRGWFARVREDANSLGIRAVAAPRLVSGLERLHSRHGRLPWPRVLDAAVALARSGTELDALGATFVATVMATLGRDPLASELYYAGGIPVAAPIMNPPPRIRNAGLVAALEAIREHGAPAITDGAIGSAIVALSSGGDGLGPDDLRVEGDLLDDVEPLLEYRGWRVYGSPRPSGAVTAAAILGLLDRMEPADATARSAAKCRAVLRACAAATAERFAMLAGDLDEADARRLLSDGHLDELAAAPGAGDPPRSATAPTATTTCCACDADGGASSLTSTLLTVFGAHVSVPGYGFFLNNAMQWFDPRPGRPNSIAGGKRALSAVSPVVLRDSGSPRVLALGALGGRFIFSAVAQVAHDAVRHAVPLDEAIDLPRVHVEGGRALVDERLGAGALDALRVDGLPAPEAAHSGPTSLTLARAIGVDYDRETRAATVGLDRRTAAWWTRAGAAPLVS
jgi:gamma-glutamyltranspeptidase/glutathione hydrolase